MVQGYRTHLGAVKSGFDSRPDYKVSDWYLAVAGRALCIIKRTVPWKDAKPSSAVTRSGTRNAPFREASRNASKGGGAKNGAERRGGAPRYKGADRRSLQGERESE